MTIAKICLPPLILLIILLVVNSMTVFVWIDTLVYGSPEEAQRMANEAQEHAAQVRAAENSNVFNHLESVMDGRGLYHSDYQAGWQLNDIMKVIVIAIEMMFFMSLLGKTGLWHI